MKLHRRTLHTYNLCNNYLFYLPISTHIKSFFKVVDTPQQQILIKCKVYFGGTKFFIFHVDDKVIYSNDIYK